jgi:hypothetical protein
MTSLTVVDRRKGLEAVRVEGHGAAIRNIEGNERSTEVRRVSVALFLMVLAINNDFSFHSLGHETL